MPLISNPKIFVSISILNTYGFAVCIYFAQLTGNYNPPISYYCKAWESRSERGGKGAPTAGPEFDLL